MTDAPITVAASTAAAGTAAVMSGMPTQDVVLYALAGGVVGIWFSPLAQVVFTARWVTAVVAQIAVSTGAGVTLSAVGLAMAPGYELTKPLAAVPQWALAGVIAAGIHRALPLFASWLRRRTGTEPATEGGKNDVQ